MTTGIQSKGVDLDSIFDPYVTGTSPGLTGIQSAGTDIHTRYAPLVYGTSAAATGILCKVGGTGSFVDLNALFAAKGTANYALPINGQTFTGVRKVVSGSDFATISFGISGGNTYVVAGSLAAGGSGTLTSGSIPAGATTVQYTWGTPTNPGGTGTGAGGSTTNGAASATAVSSNPAAAYTTNSFTSAQGTKQTNYPFTITFYNSVGTAISTTNITLSGMVEPAV